MNFNSYSRSILRAFLLSCFVALLATGFDLLRVAWNPWLELTASASQRGRAEADPAMRVRRREEELRARDAANGFSANRTLENRKAAAEAFRKGLPVATAERYRELRALAAVKNIPDLIREGKLSELIAMPDFGHLPNSRELADAYLVSHREYQIEGVRQDGHTDRIHLSGKSLWLFAENDYFKALPGDPDDYRQVKVSYSPDNSYVVHPPRPAYAVNLSSEDSSKLSGKISLEGTKSKVVQIDRGITKYEFQSNNGSKLLGFERAGGSWHALRVPKVPTRTASSAAEFRTLRVSQMKDGTMVSIYPAAAEGGTAIWFVTQEDRGATAEIADLVGRSSGVAHTGDDLPARWLKALLAKNKGPYIRKSDRSANLSNSDLQKAAALGAQALSSANTKIFNALPQEEGLTSSWMELWKMGLELGQRKEWKELNAAVRRSAETSMLRVTAAKKKEVLNEFESGISNVVFVVAHSSGGVMYLPGREGESISLADLSAIKREVTPERVVVLIICKGGTVNSNSASFGEVLLQNKLARGVFASPEDVDARVVPKLMEEISREGTIGEVLNRYGFQHIARFLRSRKPGREAS